jgi:hypothetical protein
MVASTLTTEAQMPLTPKLSKKPVTGSFRPSVRKPLGPDEHHIGWNRALQAALDDIGRPKGDYQVHVEFSAVVNVKNPGNVIEYCVTLI